VNGVACFVEHSSNRYLLALVLLRIFLIIEEMSGRFSIGRLAREQGELSGCEFYDLAGKCLACWLGLWLLARGACLRLPWHLRLGLRLLPRHLGLSLLRLPGLLGVVGTLRSQAWGRDTEGRRQNQREHLSGVRGSHFHIFVHDLFRVYLQLRFNDRLLNFQRRSGVSKTLPLSKAFPLQKHIFRHALLAFSTFCKGRIGFAEGYLVEACVCLT